MKRTLSILLAAVMILSVGTLCYADNLFCRNCGKSIPTDSKFCQYCGTEVINNTAGGDYASSNSTETDTTAGITINEKGGHYITVSRGDGCDIWICDTDTNLITGDPTLEYYGHNYMHNNEICLFLFQRCLPGMDLSASSSDVLEALHGWFETKLGGENRAFSRNDDETGFILILHSDNMLTPERYPFAGTCFCSPAYWDIELFWEGPFNSTEEAMELQDGYLAGYPVEINDGEYHCLKIWSCFGEEWMKIQQSPFNPDSATKGKVEIEGFTNAPQGEIPISSENWGKYFDVVEDVEDTSLILDDAGFYSCNLHTKLMLKDRFAAAVDGSHDNEVVFSVQYKECMGLFSYDFNEENGFITIKDPDSFSTVKTAETADYIYRFPEEDSVSAIPVHSIMSTTPFGNAIGFANRYVEVVSASGTLWFK